MGPAELVKVFLGYLLHWGFVEGRLAFIMMWWRPEWVCLIVIVLASMVGGRCRANSRVGQVQTSEAL